MCRTVYGDMHLKSPGINRKSRVLYSGPGFVSSAIWLSLPKKHYNGLINHIQSCICLIYITITLLSKLKCTTTSTTMQTKYLNI